MLRFEFKKQLTAFGILLTVTMFSLNLAVAAFFWRDGFSSDARDAAAARDELLALYESDRARYDEIYADFRSRVSAYEAEQYTYLLSNDGRALSVFENKLIDTDSYGDMRLFYDLDAIINRPESYRAALSGCCPTRRSAYRSLTAATSTAITRTCCASTTGQPTCRFRSRRRAAGTSFFRCRRRLCFSPPRCSDCTAAASRSKGAAV